jgi:hypothetical protein
MTTVSIDEAARDLPTLLHRAQTESIAIRDENGDTTMLLSLKPREKTAEERSAAIQRMNDLSRQASAELEESLAKDGITVEEFLADALADV